MTNRPVNADEANYRNWLIKAEHKASRDFDRAVMTLSGGALGVSIAFIHNVVPHPVQSSVIWLTISWSLLVFSLVAILASTLTSQFGLRHAISQVDAGTIYTESPGGLWVSVTIWLNIVAASTFVLGVAFLVIFALLNTGPFNMGRTS